MDSTDGMKFGGLAMGDILVLWFVGTIGVVGSCDFYISKVAAVGCDMT